MYKLLSLFLLVFLFISPSAVKAQPDDFYNQRKAMVNTQLKTRGIIDPNVLKAMLKLKREYFVPVYLRSLAYSDSPLPIGEGQTISQPYIVALMTQSLGLKSTDKVLEIGTGSGYQAAILAEIAKEVYTIEILEALFKRAADLLNKLNYKNIRFKCGDGYRGWPEYAPFDAIIVTCAPQEIPPSLIEQLADGGRLVIPVGEEGKVQNLILVKKKGNAIEKFVITGCLFVPMIKKER